MQDLPPVGTRVSLRYRLPAGSAPPLSDVVGHLIEVGATVRVRDKRGDVVAIEATDLVVVKALAAVPVRNPDIRRLEHAAALAWPGVQWHWQDGWLLRFGHGSTRRANSAVPLEVSPSRDLGAISRWYADRRAPALMALPDRLFPVPAGLPTDGENLVMTRDLAPETYSTVDTAQLAASPDDGWLGLHPRRVPVDVLTAVIDGELAFASVAGAAVGRGAVTAAPDGIRWAGLSSVHVADDARRRGLGRAVCEALLGWAAERGATRAYVQVVVENTAAIRLYESMGFTVHHRSRYASLG